MADKTITYIIDADTTRAETAVGKIQRDMDAINDAAKMFSESFNQTVLDSGKVATGSDGKAVTTGVDFLGTNQSNIFTDEAKGSIGVDMVTTAATMAKEAVESLKNAMASLGNDEDGRRLGNVFRNMYQTMRRDLGGMQESVTDFSDAMHSMFGVDKTSGVSKNDLSSIVLGSKDGQRIGSLFNNTTRSAVAVQQQSSRMSTLSDMIIDGRSNFGITGRDFMKDMLPELANSSLLSTVRNINMARRTDSYSLDDLVGSIMNDPQGNAYQDVKKIIESGVAGHSALGIGGSPSSQDIEKYMRNAIKATILANGDSSFGDVGAFHTTANGIKSISRSAVPHMEITSPSSPLEKIPEFMREAYKPGYRNNNTVTGPTYFKSNVVPGKFTTDDQGNQIPVRKGVLYRSNDTPYYLDDDITKRLFDLANGHDSQDNGYLRAAMIKAGVAKMDNGFFMRNQQLTQDDARRLSTVLAMRMYESQRSMPQYDADPLLAGAGEETVMHRNSKEFLLLKQASEMLAEQEGIQAGFTDSEYDQYMRDGYLKNTVDVANGIRVGKLVNNLGAARTALIPNLRIQKGEHNELTMAPVDYDWRKTGVQKDLATDKFVAQSFSQLGYVGARKYNEMQKSSGATGPAFRYDNTYGFGRDENGEAVRGGAPIFISSYAGGEYGINRPDKWDPFTIKENVPFSTLYRRAVGQNGYGHYGENGEAVKLEGTDKYYVPIYQNGDQYMMMEQEELNKINEERAAKGLTHLTDYGDTSGVTSYKGGKVDVAKTIKHINAMHRMATPGTRLEDLIGEGFNDTFNPAMVDLEGMANLFNVDKNGEVTHFQDSSGLIRSDALGNNPIGNGFQLRDAGGTIKTFLQAGNFQEAIIAAGLLDDPTHSNYLRRSVKNGDNEDAYYVPMAGNKNATAAAALIGSGVVSEKFMKDYGSFITDYGKSDVAGAKYDITGLKVGDTLTDEQRHGLFRAFSPYFYNLLEKETGANGEQHYKYNALLDSTTMKNDDKFARMDADLYDTMFRNGRAEGEAKEEARKQGRLDANGITIQGTGKSGVVNLTAEEQQRYRREESGWWGGALAVQSAESFAREKDILPQSMIDNMSISDKQRRESEKNYQERVLALRSRQGKINFLRGNPAAAIQLETQGEGWVDSAEATRLIENELMTLSNQHFAGSVFLKKGEGKKYATIESAKANLEDWVAELGAGTGLSYEQVKAASDEAVNGNRASNPLAIALNAALKQAGVSDEKVISGSNIGLRDKNGDLYATLNRAPFAGGQMDVIKLLDAAKSMDEIKAYKTAHNLKESDSLTADQVKELGIDEQKLEAYKLAGFIGKNYETSGMFLDADRAKFLNTADFDGDTVWQIAMQQSDVGKDIIRKSRDYIRKTGYDAIDKSMITDEKMKNPDGSDRAEPASLGDIAIDAILNGYSSQTGMGLGSAGIREAMRLPDNDPSKIQLLSQFVRYYDLATSEVQNKGIKLKMTPQMQKLVGGGELYSRFMKRLSDDAQEEGEVADKYHIFRARMTSADDYQGISELMARRNAALGGYDVGSFQQNLKHYVNTYFDPDSYAGAAATKFAKMYSKQQTGFGMITNEDIDEYEKLVNAWNTDVVRREKVDGGNSSAFKQEKAAVGYALKQVTALKGKDSTMLTERGVRNSIDTLTMQRDAFLQQKGLTGATQEQIKKTLTPEELGQYGSYIDRLDMLKRYQHQMSDPRLQTAYELNQSHLNLAPEDYVRRRMVSDTLDNFFKNNGYAGGLSDYIDAVNADNPIRQIVNNASYLFDGRHSPVSATSILPYLGAGISDEHFGEMRAYGVDGNNLQPLAKEDFEFKSYDREGQIRKQVDMLLDRNTSNESTYMGTLMHKASEIAYGMGAGSDEYKGLGESFDAKTGKSTYKYRFDPAAIARALVTGGDSLRAEFGDLMKTQDEKDELEAMIASYSKIGYEDDKSHSFGNVYGVGGSSNMDIAIATGDDGKIKYAIAPDAQAGAPGVVAINAPTLTSSNFIPTPDGTRSFSADRYLPLFDAGFGHNLDVMFAGHQTINTEGAQRTTVNGRTFETGSSLLNLSDFYPEAAQDATLKDKRVAARPDNVTRYTDTNGETYTYINDYKSSDLSAKHVPIQAGLYALMLNKLAQRKDYIDKDVYEYVDDIDETTKKPKVDPKTGKTLKKRVEAGGQVTYGDMYADFADMSKIRLRGLNPYSGHSYEFDMDAEIPKYQRRADGLGYERVQGEKMKYSELLNDMYGEAVGNVAKTTKDGGDPEAILRTLQQAVREDSPLYDTLQDATNALINQSHADNIKAQRGMINVNGTEVPTDWNWMTGVEADSVKSFEDINSGLTKRLRKMNPSAQHGFGTLSSLQSELNGIDISLVDDLTEKALNKQNYSLAARLGAIKQEYIDNKNEIYANGNKIVGKDMQRNNNFFTRGRDIEADEGAESYKGIYQRYLNDANNIKALQDMYVAQNSDQNVKHLNAAGLTTNQQSVIDAHNINLATEKDLMVKAIGNDNEKYLTSIDDNIASLTGKKSSKPKDSIKDAAEKAKQAVEDYIISLSLSLTNIQEELSKIPDTDENKGIRGVLQERIDGIQKKIDSMTATKDANGNPIKTAAEQAEENAEQEQLLKNYAKEQELSKKYGLQYTNGYVARNKVLSADQLHKDWEDNQSYYRAIGINDEKALEAANNANIVDENRLKMQTIYKGLGDNDSYNKSVVESSKTAFKQRLKDLVGEKKEKGHLSQEDELYLENLGFTNSIFSDDTATDDKINKVTDQYGERVAWDQEHNQQMMQDRENLYADRIGNQTQASRANLDRLRVSQPGAYSNGIIGRTLRTTDQLQYQYAQSAANMRSTLDSMYTKRDQLVNINNKDEIDNYEKGNYKTEDIEAYIAQREKMRSGQISREDFNTWAKSDAANGITDSIANYHQATKGIQDQTDIANETQKLADLQSTPGGMIQNALGTVSQSISSMASGLIHRYFYQIISQVKQFVTTYNKQLTEIKMIKTSDLFEVSDEEMSEISDKIISQAKELKASISDIATIKSSLYRQGLSDSEVDKRTASITKFSKVTGIDADKATKYLTTAVNSGLVDNLEEAMDVMAALGDTAATTAEEIAKGMERSAASAETAGVSFEELTSMLTIITANTQLGGSTVGTALKTMFSRMYRVSSTQYDETTAAYDNVGTDSEISTDENGITNITFTGNDVTKALKLAGIDMTASNKEGSFQDFSDTITQLMNVWQDLTDVQKNAILYALGGARGTNTISALFESGSEIDSTTGKTVWESTLDKTENADGTVDSKYQAYLESMEAATTSLQTAWQSLIETFTNDGAITGVLGLITDLISNFEALGGTATIITALGLAVLAAGAKIAAGILLAKGAAKGVAGIVSSIAGLAVLAGGVAIASSIGSGIKNSKQEAAVSEEDKEQAKIDELSDLKTAVREVRTQLTKNKELSTTEDTSKSNREANQYLGFLETYANLYKYNGQGGYGNTSVSYNSDKLNTTLDDFNSDIAEAFGAYILKISQTIKGEIQDGIDQLNDENDVTQINANQRTYLKTHPKNWSDSDWAFYTGGTADSWSIWNAFSGDGTTKYFDMLNPDYMTDVQQKYLDNVISKVLSTHTFGEDNLGFEAYLAALGIDTDGYDLTTWEGFYDLVNANKSNADFYSALMQSGLLSFIQTEYEYGIDSSNSQNNNPGYGTGPEGAVSAAHASDHFNEALEDMNVGGVVSGNLATTIYDNIIKSIYDPTKYDLTNADSIWQMMQDAVNQYNDFMASLSSGNLTTDTLDQLFDYMLQVEDGVYQIGQYHFQSDNIDDLRNEITNLVDLAESYTTLGGTLPTWLSDLLTQLGYVVNEDGTITQKMDDDGNPVVSDAATYVINNSTSGTGSNAVNIAKAATTKTEEDAGYVNVAKVLLRIISDEGIFAALNVGSSNEKMTAAGFNYDTLSDFYTQYPALAAYAVTANNGSQLAALQYENELARIKYGNDSYLIEGYDERKRAALLADAQRKYKASDGTIYYGDKADEMYKKDDAAGLVSSPSSAPADGTLGDRPHAGKVVHTGVARGTYYNYTDMEAPEVDTEGMTEEEAAEAQANAQKFEEDKLITSALAFDIQDKIGKIDSTDGYDDTETGYLQDLENYKSTIGEDAYNILMNAEVDADGNIIDPDVVERATQAMEEYDYELGVEAVKASGKFGDQTEDVADAMEIWSKDAKTASTAAMNWSSKLAKAGEQNKKLKAWLKDGSNSSYVANLFGVSTSDLNAHADAYREAVQELIDANNELADTYVQAQVEADELQGKEYAMDENGMVGNFDTSQTATLQVTEDGQIITSDNFTDLPQEIYDDMMAKGEEAAAHGVAVTYEGKFVETGDESAKYEFSATDVQSTTGNSGGGGGGGKSKSAKLIEKWGHKTKLKEHEIEMNKSLISYYEETGQYTQAKQVTQDNISAMTSMNTTYQEEIDDLLKQQSKVKKGSDDWYSLEEAIQTAEKAIADNNTEIAKSVNQLDEYDEKIRKTTTDIEDTIVKEIETRKDEAKTILESTASMEQTITDLIKQRYQDEWDLIKQDIDIKKQALQDEMELIDEKLNARKNAEDEASKYEELQEYQKQLALVELDSTRTKDAAELRKKIQDLENELSWSEAENETENYKQELQDQIDAYDAYETTGDTQLEKYLEDANNFADEVNNVLSLSYEDLIAWLEKMDDSYANSLTATQGTMIESWEDTWKKMKGITDKYWVEVAGIMESEESYIAYMMESTEYKNASDTGKEALIASWKEKYDAYLESHNTAEAISTHSDNALTDVAKGNSSNSTDIATVNDQAATLANLAKEYATEKIGQLQEYIVGKGIKDAIEDGTLTTIIETGSAEAMTVTANTFKAALSDMTVGSDLYNETQEAIDNLNEQISTLSDDVEENTSAVNANTESTDSNTDNTVTSDDIAEKLNGSKEDFVSFMKQSDAFNEYSDNWKSVNIAMDEIYYEEYRALLDQNTNEAKEGIDNLLSHLVDEYNNGTEEHVPTVDDYLDYMKYKYEYEYDKASDEEKESLIKEWTDQWNDYNSDGAEITVHSDSELTDISPEEEKIAEEKLEEYKQNLEDYINSSLEEPEELTPITMTDEEINNMLLSGLEIEQSLEAEKAAAIAKAEAEEKARQEEEARLKAEEEARIKAQQEEEARLKAEEEARIAAEEAAKAQAEAEEQARIAAEKKAEEEKKAAEEAEARRIAEEEAAKAKAEAEEEARQAAIKAAQEAAEKAAQERADKIAKEQETRSENLEKLYSSVDEDSTNSELKKVASAIYSYIDADHGKSVKTTENAYGDPVTKTYLANGSTSWALNRAEYYKMYGLDNADEYYDYTKELNSKTVKLQNEASEIKNKKTITQDDIERLKEIEEETNELQQAAEDIGIQLDAVVKSEQARRKKNYIASTLVRLKKNLSEDEQEKYIEEYGSLTNLASAMYKQGTSDYSDALSGADIDRDISLNQDWLINARKMLKEFYPELYDTYTDEDLIKMKNGETTAWTSEGDGVVSIFSDENINNKLSIYDEYLKANEAAKAAEQYAERAREEADQVGTQAAEEAAERAEQAAVDARQAAEKIKSATSLDEASEYVQYARDTAVSAGEAYEIAVNENSDEAWAETMNNDPTVVGSDAWLNENGFIKWSDLTEKDKELINGESKYTGDVSTQAYYNFNTGEVVDSSGNVLYGDENTSTEGLSEILLLLPEDISYLKDYVGYSTGGLVDSTGLAMLHGTANAPEYVLNAEQTAGFLKLMDAMSYVLAPSISGYDMSSIGSNSTTIGDIHVTINEADLGSSADIEDTAEKIGNAIVDQLVKNGVYTSNGQF